MCACVQHTPTLCCPLTQELNKARPAAGERDAHLAAAPEAAEVFDGNRLLVALRECVGQLARLRDTLLTQVTGMHTVYIVPCFEIGARLVV